MKTLYKYILLTILALQGLPAMASVLFVNGKTGNDIYDGTTPTFHLPNHGPKKTISAAVTLSPAEQDIYIANANYPEAVIITKSLNFHTSSNVNLNTLTMNAFGVSLTLDGYLYVNTSLNLNQGHILTDSNSLVVVKYTTTQTGGSTASFVNGPMGVSLASIYLHRILRYPIGKDTTFRPMIFDVHAEDAHNNIYVGEVFNEAPMERCIPAEEHISNVSQTRFWRITSSCTCIKTGTVTLSYGSDDGATGYDSLIIVKNDEEMNIGCWQNLQGEASGPPFGYIVSDCRFTGCGEFTLGNVEESTIPLPVQLVSFNAENMGPKYVKLNWATASEINNDYIAIERTADMMNWAEVCKLPGHGTTNVRHDYTCTDSTAADLGHSLVYYRPKQADYNGVIEYFNVIKIRLESGADVMSVDKVYPNPAIDRINIRYTANSNNTVNIRLLSLEGKMILHSAYTAQEGTQTVDIDLPENSLTPGMYLLEVENGTKVFRQKVYKQ